MQQGGTGIKLKFWLISKHDILICGWYFCTKSHIQCVVFCVSVFVWVSAVNVFTFKIYITLAYALRLKGFYLYEFGLGYLYDVRAVEGFRFVVAYTILIDEDV